MSLLASASQRWWGGSSFNYDYGARLEVERRVFAGLRLSGRALWSDRKYQQNPGLNGPLMVFSLGGTYVPFPIVQVNTLVGYSQQDSQARRWDSTGYWTRVGTNVALPWGFTVGASAEFRWTNYESGWLPFIADNSTPREDQTRILQATLLNRAVTVYGFSPQILFSNELRESNAQLFDFKTQPRGNALGPPVLMILFCHPRLPPLLSSSTLVPDACPPIPDYKRRGQALIGDPVKEWIQSSKGSRVLFLFPCVCKRGIKERFMDL